MTPIQTMNDVIIPAAMLMLPDNMNTPAARAMMLAIALQESRIVHRRQIRGPARGYWQFETAGCAGVLAHRSSADHARRICAAMNYNATVGEVYNVLADNDLLAAAFARLLLWTLPSSLPDSNNPEEGWKQYIAAWRPGKPHRQTWDAFYKQAWQIVDGSRTSVTSVGAV
jgi:hypothetical protein